LKWVYLALTTTIAILGVVVASELNSFKLFDIEVNVNVPVEEVIKIKLNVDRPSGSVTYHNVSSVRLGKDTGVVFKLLSAEVSGDVKIALNGRATLVSDDGKSYSIPMPCLFSNVECVRVLMIIPGYDEPTPLPRGRYTISLELSWFEASGEGSIRLGLGLLTSSPP